MKSEESQYWRRHSSIASHSRNELLGRQSTGKVGDATPEISNPSTTLALNYRGYIYDGERLALLVIRYSTLHEDTLSP